MWMWWTLLYVIGFGAVTLGVVVSMCRIGKAADEATEREVRR
jgi:hypothetical protein